MRLFFTLVTITLVIGTLLALPQGIPEKCLDGSDCDNYVETIEENDPSSEATFSSSNEEELKHLRRKPEDCPPCPRIYLPVCGTDGTEIREFSNDCMMEFFNCIEYRAFTLLRTGTCD